MKRILMRAIMALIPTLACAQSTDYDTNRGFVHPGCLHTEADFDRIKAQLADGRFIGGTGIFPTIDYSTRSHSFLFEPLQGTDHYNITRLSGYTTYWCGWRTNGRINGSDSKEPLEYPFTIVKAETTSIQSCHVGLNVPSTHYTLSGTIAPKSYKGIVIEDGKKIIY